MKLTNLQTASLKVILDGFHVTESIETKEDGVYYTYHFPDASFCWCKVNYEEYKNPFMVGNILRECLLEAMERRWSK